MTQLNLETSYIVHSSTPITLPEGKTQNDIEDIFVKYGHVTITFTDKTIYEGIIENDTDFDTLEYKYPDKIRLYFRENDDKPQNLVYEKE